MKILVAKDDTHHGPFEIDELIRLMRGGTFAPSDLAWSEGWDDWVPLSEVEGIGASAFDRSKSRPQVDTGAGLFSGVAEKVSQASGLERLEGFSFTQLFSQVFRKHSPEEIEEHFSAGTIGTTPTLNEVVARWPTPWAFVRLLGMSVLAAIAFYWAISRFGNPMLVPGWIFVGCFGFPFAMLVFFVEANILKNISFYRVLSLLFMGGLLSIIVSLFLFECSMLDAWMGAMSAGLVEEFGKLLAVVFFTRKWTQFHWILNGMLFGAAVGTGFSAFESAGYVFVSFGNGVSLAPEATMIFRALLSPFTHTIWTAALAAALWRVRGRDSFHWGMLMDFRFLRIFGIIAALHILWNSPLALPILGGDTGYFALRILIGILGWIVILLLIQAGIKEVSSAQQGSEQPKEA